MKQLDLVMFLVVLVAVGSMITGMAKQQERHPHVLVSESSIR